MLSWWELWWFSQNGTLWNASEKYQAEVLLNLAFSSPVKPTSLLRTPVYVWKLYPMQMYPFWKKMVPNRKCYPTSIISKPSFMMVDSPNSTVYPDHKEKTSYAQVKMWNNLQHKIQDHLGIVSCELCLQILPRSQVKNTVSKSSREDMQYMEKDKLVSGRERDKSALIQAL